MSYVRPEIAAMSGYTPGEQPQSGKFIKLNTNENPYPPSPSVSQAIVHAAENGLVRYPDPLANSFRLVAAEQWGVEPDWILCGNGSDDILTICTRAFVGAGQKIRLPYPSYVLYRTLAEIQGAEAEEVKFDSDWSLDDSFAAADEKLRLVFLPNPNSPSGTLLSPERVLQLAEQLPCPLIVDEAYADFSGVSCASLVRENEKILVTRTLSKSFALAGLRFGYVIAQPQIVRELCKVKDSYNCDALAIAAATAALLDRDWLQGNVARVIETRGRLEAGMKSRGFDVTPSSSNFVWCTRPQQPLQPVFEELKKNRVLVRYMKYPGWGEGLRVSVGTDEQMDAFFAVLDGMNV